MLLGFLDGRNEGGFLLRSRKSLDRRDISDEGQQSFRDSGGNKTGGKDLNRMVSALIRCDSLRFEGYDSVGVLQRRL